jgi:formate hydrogenlyase transcriptional activator
MTTTIPVVEEAFPPSPLRERLDEPDWTESGTNNGRIAEHYAHLRENYTRLQDEHTRLREEYRRFREEQARLPAECATLREESAALRAAQSEPGSPIMSGRSAGEIIGQSPAFRAVLKQVQIVAPTNATVLIHGETGTGKELIAQAVHRYSSRRDRALARINCAAIPSGLLESELFGHEKGAFTGAIARKAGRFELAHQGTLFLDEVGDIPLELQPKLLRVLQEREFERLGSTQTQRINVRLVAATSRDLSQMAAARQFREDLYYRLNVFPIRVPPLRERVEDIPLLVRYFVNKYAHEMNKRIETVPSEVLGVLRHYHWPGNVRELENFVERAVILSRTTVLNPPLDELQSSNGHTVSGARGATAKAATLEECEREHIMLTLGKTRWVVGGPNGAAARLGLKRTTLIWKMQKLGIDRTANLPEPNFAAAQ